MKKTALLLSIVLCGCAAKPSASDVCGKLVAAGIAANCKQGSPKMFTARAKTVFDFDLVSVKGKGGAVLDFERSDDFDATVKAFEGAAMLAGPHRYGSSKALIFVQMNDGASPAVGAKTKGVVDAL